MFEEFKNEFIRYLSEFGSTEPTQEESNKIWIEKVAGGKKRGKTYRFGSRNELRRLRAGWAGIGSSRQVKAIDGVHFAAMSQQITDLSRSFAQSVAQNEVMSKTVEELKKQVVSMSHRHHHFPSPDSSSKEETESDEFVDPTP